MNTKEQANLKCVEFYNWFMEVRKEFPNVELQKSGNDVAYKLYFIGNKSVGDDYELTCWKEVPILECKIMQYSPNHPVEPNQYYLDLSLNFRGYSSSEDWKMDEKKFKEETKKAFIGAIDDFIIEKV
jgi:hypothetical protein